MAKRTERTERKEAPARIVVEIQELLRVAQPIDTLWLDLVGDVEMSSRFQSLVLNCARYVGYMADWIIHPDEKPRMRYAAEAAKHIGSYVLGILDSPNGCGVEDQYIQRLAEQARINLAKWGQQDLETLALAAVEECGELAQAVLRWTKEGIGGFAAVEAETIDLGAVCVQILWLMDQQQKGA